jgi:hypothetical protein
MNQNVLLIVFFLFMLVACCILPMLFMKRHRKRGHHPGSQTGAEAGRQDLDSETHRPEGNTHG